LSRDAPGMAQKKSIVLSMSEVRTPLCQNFIMPTPNANYLFVGCDTLGAPY